MSSSDITGSNRRLLRTLVIISGILTVVIAGIDPLLAGIPAIVCGVLLLSYFISEDASRNAKPVLIAEFNSDGRSVRIENTGMDTARGIRVEIHPGEHRFELPSLGPDKTASINLPTVLLQGKVFISWKDGNGREHERQCSINNLSGETDPLKPAFPLFSWKK